MMEPFNNRYSNPNTTLLGGWSNHIIGKSYIDIHPYQERKIIATTYKSKSCYKRHKTALKELNYFMGRGICSANFYSPLHIDPKDGNNITNVAYSVPISWQKKSTTQAVFNLGNYVIDIGKQDSNIVFLGNHSVHSTGIQFNSERCLKNLPNILKGEYTLERALNEKDQIRKYMNSALIGWGHFGRSTSYHNDN